MVALLLTLVASFFLYRWYQHSFFQKYGYETLYESEPKSISISYGGDTLQLDEKTKPCYPNFFYLFDANFVTPFHKRFERDEDRCVTVSVQDVVEIYVYPYEEKDSIVVMKVKGKQEKVYHSVTPFSIYLLELEQAKRYISGLE